MKPQPRPNPPQSIINQIALTFLEVIILHVKILYYILEALIKPFMSKKFQNVEGEIVLITGAAHGIGRELALEYASKGATIVCWDINDKGNQETVKDIKAQGGNGYAYVCNVSNKDEVLQVAEKVKREVGFVSILVNNAGIMPTHPLLDHTEKEIRLMYDINVMAHFWTIQAFLPEMIDRKRGHIVALSSCAGLFGLVNLVPYCGTKFAVRGVMSALYTELCSIGLEEHIKVTTIFPYMVDTGLCKRPRYRFNILKLVNPTDAAQSIVAAQRSGEMEVSLPRFFRYLEGVLNILPIKVTKLGNEFLDTGVDSDL